MKAISIRQPWAWAILHAGKDIENRDWPTKVRGTVLIHASKGMTKDEYSSFVDTCRAARQADDRVKGYIHIPDFDELQRGGIVGQVEITGCAVASMSPWFFGRYGFVLRDPKPLPFRPFKGALGFFEVPDA